MVRFQSFSDVLKISSSFDIVKLPQQDQGALGDVICAWLDLEEREEGHQDLSSSDDIEDTGMTITVTIKLAQ